MRFSGVFVVAVHYMNDKCATSCNKHASEDVDDDAEGAIKPTLCAEPSLFLESFRCSIQPGRCGIVEHVPCRIGVAWSGAYRSR